MDPNRIAGLVAISLGIAFAIALLLLLFWLRPFCFRAFGYWQRRHRSADTAGRCRLRLPILRDAAGDDRRSPKCTGNLGAGDRRRADGGGRYRDAAGSDPRRCSGHARGRGFGRRRPSTSGPGVDPGLTALVTFVGLVLTSLMKWRTDLRNPTARKFSSNSSAALELEQERHDRSHALTAGAGTAAFSVGCGTPSTRVEASRRATLGRQPAERRAGCRKRVVIDRGRADIRGNAAHICQNTA